MSELILPDYEESWVLTLAYFWQRVKRPFYRGIVMKGNLSERKARTAFDRLVRRRCLECIGKYGNTHGAWAQEYRLTPLGRAHFWNLMRYYYVFDCQVEGSQETVDRMLERRLIEWGFRTPTPDGVIPFIHQKLGLDLDAGRTTLSDSSP